MSRIASVDSALCSGQTRPARLRCMDCIDCLDSRRGPRDGAGCLAGSTGRVRLSASLAFASRAHPRSGFINVSSLHNHRTMAPRRPHLGSFAPFSLGHLWANRLHRNARRAERRTIEGGARGALRDTGTRDMGMRDTEIAGTAHGDAGHGRHQRLWNAGHGDTVDSESGRGDAGRGTVGAGEWPRTQRRRRQQQQHRGGGRRHSSPCSPPTRARMSASSGTHRSRAYTACSSPDPIPCVIALLLLLSPSQNPSQIRKDAASEQWNNAAVQSEPLV
ncbi:unnamed protein product [Lampetra planeri]